MCEDLRIFARYHDPSENLAETNSPPLGVKPAVAAADL